MTTQKETLQTKDIVGYLPFGLKCNYKPNYEFYDGEDWFNVDGLNAKNGHFIISGQGEYYSHQHHNLDKLDLLLYPLSHLTKEIPFNGGTIVPLIELVRAVSLYDTTGCNYEYGCDNDSDNYWINVFTKSGDLLYYLEYVGGNFYTDNEEPKHCFDQHALFQLLYQYKIDFLGLIDKGLAVDVSTLTVNPYL